MIVVQHKYIVGLHSYNCKQTYDEQ